MGRRSRLLRPGSQLLVCLAAAVAWSSRPRPLAACTTATAAPRPSLAVGARTRRAGSASERLPHGKRRLGSAGKAKAKASPEGPGSTERGDGCLCSFGVIGDIQYADCEDGTDFSGYQRRYFRGTLDRVRDAVERWIHEDRVDFAVQLGDAIDGRNKDAGHPDQALAAVLAEFPDGLPRCDLLGNHELYNFPRDGLDRTGLRLRGQGLPGARPGAEDGCYFHFLADGPSGRWEVICLDAYDMATIGYADDDERRLNAETWLAQINPRTTLQGVDWFEGLPPPFFRFVPYNGGVDRDQLRWLQGRLAACTHSGKKAIVFSHIPILEASTTPKTILWNAEEVLSLLRSDDGRCVVAVLAGHDHDGGYAVDPESGIHHVTFLSPLGCEPGSGRSGAATVRCFQDHAEIFGHGVFCAESGTGGRGRPYTHISLRRADPREVLESTCRPESGQGSPL